MSESSPFGFDIGQILVYAIPGGFLLSPIILSLYLGANIAPATDNVNIVIGILVFFVAGIFIDQIRATYFKTPADFNRLLYRVYREEAYLPLWSKVNRRLQSKLGHEWEIENGVESELNVDFEQELSSYPIEIKPSNADHLYDLILLDLDLSRRTAWQKTVHEFMQNLRISNFGIVILILSSGIQFSIEQSEQMFITTTASFAIFIISFSMLQYFNIAGETYVSLLAKEINGNS
ncbi:hypothetical protein RBH20_19735 [Haloarcula sp. H-GB4]|uniref:hypothetical protein n=1 Tax=Haloarcula sp. H-GB4 TaxID=3069755 RepID=UPI0027B759D0|nr:hypothetical protein [Haloarcula sp. H-GB4]MDQ2074762.1 hypothetical protein [Haloarcula sp. H-GB4]